MADNDTIEEIQKLIEAYSIDPFRMVSLAEDIISDHQIECFRGTKKGGEVKVKDKESV